MMALSAKLGMMMALNAKTENATQNVKLKMRRDNEEEICPSVACCYNS